MLREYRKTATILAEQYLGPNVHVAGVCTGPHGSYNETAPHIHGLEGDHSVSVGDWIATGIQGEHWAIKPDVFAATYEEVTEGASLSPVGSEIREKAIRECAEKVCTYCAGTHKYINQSTDYGVSCGRFHRWSDGAVHPGQYAYRCEAAAILALIPAPLPEKGGTL